MNNTYERRAGGVAGLKERLGMSKRETTSYRGAEPQKKRLSKLQIGGIIAGSFVVGAIAAGGTAYFTDRLPGFRETPAITTPGQMPSMSAETIRQAQVAIEVDGRVWQPQIRSGHAPYETSFTAPTSGNMDRLFNGVNAQLLQDTNKDGVADKLIASGGNAIPVKLEPGAWYKVKGGASNGGFSLEIPTQR